MGKRSTRPRDRLGRPLDHADVHGVAFPPAPEVADLSADRAWTLGIDYVDEGLPFHAHEIFEQRWKCCPAQERQSWQVLAQWGAAMTHLARGNRAGAARVAARALDSWQELTDVPAPIVRARVTESLTQLAASGVGGASGR